MKKTFSRLLLISALLVTACNPTFKDFSSETGEFSISAPGTLEESQQSVETPVGPINIHTFTAETRNSAYVVAYSDYPAEIVAQTNPEELLNSSRDGALRNLNGELISEEPIELDGNPGRSLLIDTTTDAGEPATINSRIYLVENRLYQVLVVTPKDQADKADSGTFLDSFTLQ